MLSQTYIALLTAFGGIVLGFLVSQLGDYLQSNRQDKRVLKQVLFNQLDIWVEMKRADVESLAPLLIAKLQQALLNRGVPREQVNEMFSISLTPIIELFRSLKLSAPEKLKERYQDSVHQLAEIDPLLAYQLSGRPQTDFNEVVDTFIAKAAEIEADKTESSSSPDAAAHFSAFIKGYGQHKMLSNMEADIVDVARKISYITAFRTRRVLQRLTTNLAEEAEKYIDQFLDSLIMHVAAQGTSGPIPKSDSEQST
jgi:hypothetical protein